MIVYRQHETPAWQVRRLARERSKPLWVDAQVQGAKWAEQGIEIQRKDAVAAGVAFRLDGRRVLHYVAALMRGGYHDGGQSDWDRQWRAGVMTSASVIILRVMLERREIPRTVAFV